MSCSDLHNSAIEMDEITVAFYLRVPRSHVVLLQTFFELYDGLGAVRTLRGPEPIVCVLTTKAQQEDCSKVLEALRGDVHWELAKEVPTDDLLNKADNV